MVQQEHRISYGGGAATRESLKKVKPDKAPQRGPGIAELEKLRREESQKRFSSGTELVFHPFCPQPNATVPFLPGFDPSSPFGYHVENLPIFRSQSLDSSPLISSDGTMPLLRSSSQSDASSSSNSHFSLAVSELKQAPWEPQLLLPLQKHELRQQISQVMNHSSLPLHSVPGAGLQMELELPSNQSHYGIMDASSLADQQIMMHPIVAMNHPWPFQMDAGQNRWVTDCATMMINGTQGENTDWSIEGALSLHNVGANLSSNHSAMMRIDTSEVDVVRPIDGSTLSLVCLPSVCCSAWSPKTMPIRHLSEMNVTKRQKRTEGSARSEGSAAPSEALLFYNFMELPHNDFVADRHLIAIQNEMSWEGSDAVDVDLKL